MKDAISRELEKLYGGEWEYNTIARFWMCSDGRTAAWIPKCGCEKLPCPHATHLAIYGGGDGTLWTKLNRSRL